MPDIRAWRQWSPRRRVLGAVAMSTAVALIAGTLAVGVWRAASISAAESDWETARASFVAERNAAGVTTAAASGTVAGARSALDSSAGKVFTEDTRITLAAVIDGAEARIDLARTELAAAKKLDSPAADAGLFAPGSGLRRSIDRLAPYRFDAAAATAGIREELAVPTADLTAAVAAWQAEQDRIIRERYNKVVHAVGWIPELDQCLGSVDLTAYYGTPAIAEHWSCGGKTFPDEPGTIITLSGVRSGTYRVEGIVKMLNQREATTADIPHDWDLLYQTCQNGMSYSMSLTALTRIG